MFACIVHAATSSRLWTIISSVSWLLNKFLLAVYSQAEEKEKNGRTFAQANLVGLCCRVQVLFTKMHRCLNELCYHFLYVGTVCVTSPKSTVNFVISDSQTNQRSQPKQPQTSIVYLLAQSMHWSRRWAPFRGIIPERKRIDPERLELRILRRIKER